MKTEPVLKELLDSGGECSEESRRCLARMGKAMLRYSDAMLKKKKPKGGKGKGGELTS